MTRWLLDTNVILRYLLRDHEPMYLHAERLFQRAEDGELELVILPTVLTECIYVLTSSVYRLPKTEVARVLTELILLDGVAREDTELLTECLNLVADKNVDFTDAYLECCSRRSGDGIASFDGDFLPLQFKDVVVPGENTY